MNKVLKLVYTILLVILIIILMCIPAILFNLWAIFHLASFITFSVIFLVSAFSYIGYGIYQNMNGGWLIWDVLKKNGKNLKEKNSMDK